MLDIQSYGSLLEGTWHQLSVPLVLLKLVSSYGVSISNFYNIYVLSLQVFKGAGCIGKFP